MGMMNPVVTASLFFVSSPDVGPPPFLDCGYDMDVSDVLYGSGRCRVIAARASSIIADTLVIIATWVRMWPMRSHLTKQKLTGVMFTDGSVYFIVLLGANVVALAFIETIELTYLIAQWISWQARLPFERRWLLRDLNLVCSFTVIFTCRFILDLHEAAATPPAVVPATTRHQALPGYDSSGTQFSDGNSESEPTLPVVPVRHGTGSMAKLDVSFGSMSIFGAMIPWIGTGDSEGGATGDRNREASLGLRDGSEDGSGHC
ncbi:hypothetical protein GSI_14712 [Ganoderma sinense ZZ0214-1]|uniref:Uncharacterized protein n=1 Tax=Ganoderma sinense ZZ0214-1 TaxID=1077348 RepID=A0A2G8RPI3_9APHY|nr:hypothetical protein GSI_14712 [Ganoderma sinense ZZ0214-1]